MAQSKPPSAPTTQHHGFDSRPWVNRTRPVESEVHLWWTRVDETEESELPTQWLAPAERERAERFHFPADRRQFLARRTFRREVLSGYVGSPPDQLKFRTLAHGKPELDPPCGIYFNSSNSGGLAVVAVACLPDIGVDVEQIRPLSDLGDLADQFFSSEEVALLDSGRELSYWRCSSLSGQERSPTSRHLVVGSLSP